MQRIDQLQIDVGVAGAAVQSGALSPDALSDRGLFDCGRAGRLLLLNEIGVGRAPRLRQLAVRRGELLRQLGDLRLQIRLIRFACREDLGLEFLGLLLRFLPLIDEVLIFALERKVAEDDLFDDDAVGFQMRGQNVGQPLAIMLR